MPVNNMHKSPSESKVIAGSQTVIQLTVGELMLSIAGFLLFSFCIILTLIGKQFGWPSSFQDFFRELATVVFSITFFKAAEEIFLRREDDIKRNELVENVAQQVIETLELKNNLAKAGIVDAITPFNVRKLEDIIKEEMAPGDCLYCHDGTVADIMEIRDLIIKYAIKGCKFRFMSLAPFCMNSKRRAHELALPSPGFSYEYENFGKSIEDIRNRIRDKQKSKLYSSRKRDKIDDEEVKEVEKCVENVQIRYFRSLLSVPFYLLEKAEHSISVAGETDPDNTIGRLTKAWTGFYLRRKSSGFVFLQWKSHDSDNVMKDSWPNMIQSLKEYWDFKWEDAYKEYNDSAIWLGSWNYQCTDTSLQSTPVYKGFMDVMERAGQFVAVSRRTQVCISSNVCKPYNIRWTNEQDDWTNSGFDVERIEGKTDYGSSDVIHKYHRGQHNYMFMALSYRPETTNESRVESPQNDGKSRDDLDLPCVKSFVIVKAIDTDRLEGRYYIAFADEAQKNELSDLFPSISGNINLFRVQETLKTTNKEQVQ